MIVTAILFIAILGFLIFIHELGHFVMAKRAGVRVEEFAFGFRPRLWAKKIGETEYAINLIPLGGYVRMEGENSDENGPRSYRNKSIRQRFLILIAGVVMNFSFGWLVFTILFIAGFSPLYPGAASNPFIRTVPSIVISEVTPGSPAEIAGLRAGDVVQQINGTKVAIDQEFLQLVSQQRGKNISISLQRDGKELVVSAVPRVEPPKGQGPLGVAIATSGEISSSLIAAPLAGLYESSKMVAASAVGFYDFVKQLVVRQEVSEQVTGLIGVGALTDITRKLGWEYLLQLVALITIGLATINLMPILPLDGGHIAALAYERVAKRPLSDRQLGILATAGLVFVLIIFIAVTYKDIVRFDLLGRLF